MKYHRLFLFIPVLTVFLLSACGGGETSIITPAPEKLTFLFFFTEG